MHFAYGCLIISRTPTGFWSIAGVAVVMLYFLMALFIILFLISVCVHLFVKKEPRIEMPKKIDTFVEGGMP
jgi:hypothetical protein